MDNKQKGNLATASAIHRFVSAGYTVSIPMTDTAKYDLVIEQDGRFQAVQCKYAGYEGNQGLYSVPLYIYIRRKSECWESSDQIPSAGF